MKKLFWAAAVLVAALTVGCKKGQDGNGGGSATTPTFTSVVAEETAYYGERYGEGSGFYTIMLTNADGDKLRLDCFAAVALNANTATLASGTYNVGTTADHKVRTFVAATSESDEAGTILWRNGEATLIDGGTMLVNKSGSNLKFAFEFTSNGQPVEINQFEGPVTFLNKQEYPPREEDPNPRVATSVLAQYYGIANTLGAEGGMFIMALGCNDITESLNNAEAIQINGFMPLQEDHNNLVIPEGTYEIQKGLEAMTPFKLIEGSIANSTYGGTTEFLTNDKGQLTEAWCIQEGTMTVERNGEDYKITVAFKGLRADQSGIVSQKLEEVNYVYEGPIEVANYADPDSNITENKELGTITNKALLQTSDMGNDITGYFYYIWGNGIDVSISGQNITTKGDGDMIVLALCGPASLGDRPAGVFEMGPVFGTAYADKQIAMPANPMPLQNGISPLEGCWYTYLKTVSDGAMVTSWAGAMPSQGSVTTSNEGDNHIVEFDFVDLNGHKITGTYNGPLLDSSAAAGFYWPSYPISAELANPILRAYRN